MKDGGSSCGRDTRTTKAAQKAGDESTSVGRSALILVGVTDSTTNNSPTRSWWLALAALVICAPWPGLELGIWLLGAVVGLLILLARPRGAGYWPWLGVVLAVAGAIAPVAKAPEKAQLDSDFDGHCSEMLSTATVIVADDQLNRLFAATGEALDPIRPFDFLNGIAQATDGRTIYLADDRGQLLAWGGVERAYPVDLRPLGPRAWGVEWSAARGVVYLREPMMIEGRIVGSVTVADRAELKGGTAWGMRAPPGRRLMLGRFAPGSVPVAAEVAPGAVVHVGSEAVPVVERRGFSALDG